MNTSFLCMLYSAEHIFRLSDAEALEERTVLKKENSLWSSDSSSELLPAWTAEITYGDWSLLSAVLPHNWPLRINCMYMLLYTGKGRKILESTNWSPGKRIQMPVMPQSASFLSHGSIEWTTHHLSSTWECGSVFTLDREVIWFHSNECTNRDHDILHLNMG